MFFRREKSAQPSFSERIDLLRKQGYEAADQGGKVLVTSKTGCAALVAERPDGKPEILRAGIRLGKEIGVLVHGGYQMFLRTESGKVVPALAEKLKALHAFDEDLREALGLKSLYNQSLGTTCEAHLYDRIENRDWGAAQRAWERR
jgi:hypothetical protein